jgi:hypothetical protein
LVKQSPIPVGEAPDKAGHVELIFENASASVSATMASMPSARSGPFRRTKYDTENHALLSPFRVMKVLNKFGGLCGIGE